MAFLILLHAIRTGPNVLHRVKIENIILDNVNMDSTEFESFVTRIADLYAYAVQDVSKERFAAEIMEEFYAWFLGKLHASDAGVWGREINAFSDAERETDVDVAIVYFNLPVEARDSSILDGMKMAEEHADTSPLRGHMDLAQADFIEAIINRYNYEARCGVKLIEEYNAVAALLNEGGGDASLSMVFGRYSGTEDATVNGFLLRLRKKF